MSYLKILEIEAFLLLKKRKKKNLTYFREPYSLIRGKHVS